jgi:hypothetical protein
MKWNKFVGLSPLISGFLAVLSIHASASATPTRVLKANCVWSGDDGSLIRQTCELVGNSSAGSGTSFSISWEDGVTTRLWDRRNSGNFVSMPSEEIVRLHGEYSFSRMLFPRQVIIEGKGTIMIVYDE